MHESMNDFLWEEEQKEDDGFDNFSVHSQVTDYSKAYSSSYPMQLCYPSSPASSLP